MKKRVLTIIFFTAFVISAYSGYNINKFYKYKNNKIEKNIEHSKIQNNNEKGYFYVFTSKSEISKLIGIENKFGFVDKNFYADSFINTDWYFWGNEDSIINKPLKIIAVNDEGKSMQVSRIDKISEDGNISTAKQNLNIRIPKQGVWHLNIYIDNKLFGKTTINVRKPVSDFTEPLQL
ncbi:hypothetical protein [Clostridium tyrobutyricum]|uniref:hypothetical protein n=1 Tax=Clostridium tyrobutyricum TaxID=1519 RepID=UPI0011CACA67|nr:hypothetical protein [Clostridium tyrobutyricum]